MAGLALHVVPRTKYTFDNVPSGTTFTVPIARHIDISRFREVTLLVRVHTKSLLATGSPTIVVGAVADVPTADDPAQDFLSAVLASTTIIPGTTAPSLVLVAIPANAGTMISVQLTVTQGTSAAALQSTISVDVSAKS